MNRREAKIEEKNAAKAIAIKSDSDTSDGDEKLQVINIQSDDSADKRQQMIDLMRKVQNFNNQNGNSTTSVNNGQAYG
jgi:hypothetical protein